MIRMRVSAGSAAVVQDLIELSRSLPGVQWSGYYQHSGVGNREWRVWLMGFLEGKLAIIETSGMAAPPIGSDLKPIQMPALAGFTIAFTNIGGPSMQIQTDGENGAGDGGGGGRISVPLHHIRMPSNTPNNLADFIAVMNDNLPAGGTYRKSYYQSQTGGKPWEIYAITNTIRDAASGAPAVIVYISMGGIETPPIGSEIVGVPLPTEYFDPGYMGGSMRTIGEAGFRRQSGPLRVFPA